MVEVEIDARDLRAGGEDAARAEQRTVIAAPANLGFTFLGAQNVLADRRRRGGRIGPGEIRKRLAQRALRVAVAVIERIPQLCDLAGRPSPCGAEQRAVLLGIAELRVLEILGREGILDRAFIVLARVNRQQLETMIVIQLGDGLSDEVRHARLADVVLTDRFE